MNRSLANTGMATRLVIGLVILIILTTLSAGVPAYLLTRSQLEAQTRQYLDASHRATQSLYLAEQNNVVDLTALLAERPTLQRLVQEDDLAALDQYLRNFQIQSQFDVIQVCRPEGILIAIGEESFSCPPSTTSGFALINERPTLLAARTIPGGSEGERLGVVVAGKWLDRDYLDQIGTTTGVDQSLLSPDGELLVSTLPPGRATAVSVRSSEEGNARLMTIGNAPYYVSAFMLPDQSGQDGLIAEVELSVQELARTERNALLILIASTGLVVVSGVILGSWYIRRITAPLHDLTATAERISRGELGAPIPRPSAPPELATLAASLEKSQATMLEALEERSQSRDWLDSLIQSVVEGVITFDTRGRITFLSQGAEAMSGWPAEEATGRSINEIFPLAEPHGEAFLDRIPPVGEKREIEILTRAGRNMVIATTGSRMVPPNSNTIQVALVIRDVTEEQALRNLRSFFLANISHEFRTPLSTLNASMELLMDEVDDLSPAEIRQLLKPTHLSLVSLQSLIDNLLESSSIEAGSFVLRKQSIHMNEVVADALTIIRPLVDRRQQKVAVTEPPRLEPIMADRARLTQALVNLVTNASKYSPTGQPIDISLVQSGAALRIAVADRGPGITPEDRVNLFRRFMRLQTESNEQYGIGLGLYLVKRIAEAHGGRVGVDDRSGGGAIFWMELPYDDIAGRGS
jgi:PAS domain S-box-containing protein